MSKMSKRLADAVDGAGGTQRIREMESQWSDTLRTRLAAMFPGTTPDYVRVYWSFDAANPTGRWNASAVLTVLDGCAPVSFFAASSDVADAVGTFIREAPTTYKAELARIADDLRNQAARCLDRATRLDALAGRS